MPSLHLFGPPTATLDDGAQLALAAREALLLARLLLDGPTSRAALAGFLWPLTDERRARANLRQTLLRMRRALGDVLVESAGVLALSDGVEIPREGGRLLGPIEFDDAPDLADWLAERRSRLQRDRLREGLKAAQEHLRAGRLDEALEHADTVLADEAAVEEAHRLRMQVFLARGDRAAAIAAWDDCRHALRAAYGIAPGAATNELGRQVLAAARPPSPGPAAAAEDLRRLALVGRDEASREIGAALERGFSVVVAGPGGIGKTRLLDSARAAFGASIAVGARPGDEWLPGVLISRLVAAVLEGWPQALDGRLRDELRALLPPGTGEGTRLPPLASERDYRRSLGAVTRMLQAAGGAGLRLLVVDDLQYADALSVEALAGVVGAVEPFALLVGVRAEESGDAARRLLEQLQATRRSVRIELEALTVTDISRLLGAARAAGALPPGLDLDALAQALRAQVGGSPAYVIDALDELRRRWAGGAEPTGRLAWRPGEPLPLPANLVESVQRRLGRLSPDALGLAQLAAVAGPDFSLPLAARALGRAPLALAPLFAELEAADVLSGEGFVHDLVAEAVARTLPQALRSPLHALVADHLQAQAGPAARLAHHRLAAGDRPAAASAFLAAARDARDRWQVAEAARSFSRAAELLDTAADRPRRLLAWRDSARCWLNASEPAAATRALDEAERITSDERERLLVRAARLTLSLNTGGHGDLAATARWLADALPRHEAALDDDELAHALLGVGAAAPYVAEPQALLELIDGLAQRGAPSPRLAARIALAAGMILNAMGWPARARQRLMQGDEVACRHGLAGERVNLGNQLARSEEALGDLEAASRRCLQTSRLLRELGAGAQFEADLMNLLGLYEAVRGRREAAEAAFATSRELLGSSRRPSGYMQMRHALALLHLGQPAAALAAIEATAEPLGRDRHSAFDAYWSWTWARIDAARARSPRAWLERAASACHGPDALLALRQRVLQACLDGAAPAQRATLRSVLQARELHALARALDEASEPPQAGRRPGDPDPWCAGCGPRPGLGGG